MKQFENLKLKVCGLTKPDQIQELISLNVDFLGFIFYEKSPRYVLNHLTFNQISDISHHGKVGVFVNERISKILEVSEKAKLNYIQLHGDEDENYICELREKLNSEIKLIKVFRISEAEMDLKSKIKNLKSIDYFLFDTDSKSFGGTGKTFNWEMLNKIEIPNPYFLSGGISQENANAIHHLKQQPFALDINSKFEIEPGNKDLEKIKNFLSSLI
ncbi:MAG: phosphoribosylanthranilate isomerase [Weeksellaceae bacterium]|nr:phosphoribosylanthranilate isomerase [Bacteroidota bacterium]MCG2781104.1 phosphoribosylanthranilate isomerase [Weeksellaceae bacterium]